MSDEITSAMYAEEWAARSRGESVSDADLWAWLNAAIERAIDRAGALTEEQREIIVLDMARSMIDRQTRSDGQ